MANTVIALKRSDIPFSIPTNLANGELAINYADGKLFYKNTTGDIVEISGGGGLGGNYYGTVNANGTFLISDTSGDVLTIKQGDNIVIVGDALTDSLTISANLAPAFNKANTVASDLANTAIGANNYAGVMANAANAYAASLTPDLSPPFNVANAAYSHANAAFDRANLSNDVLLVDTVWTTTNAAYDKANAANLLAYNTGIGANAWSNTKLSNTSGVTFDGNLTISSDLTIGNNLYSINSAFFDTSTGITSASKGQITWNDTEETFDLGMANGAILQVGQEIYYRVKNQTGNTIPEGTVVMSAGTLGASGRLLVTPAISDGSYPSKYLMGVVTTTMLNGEDGYVTHFGKVRGIDTSMWSEGDILYANVSVPGAFQNTAPVAPNTKTTVAIVVSKHNQTGTLFVRPTYGSKLNENELVELNGLTNSDVLQYVSANGRFENKPSLSAVNAYSISIGAASNTWANGVGTAGNSYATSIGAAGNAWSNAVGVAGNNYTVAVGTASNTWANNVGTAGNNYTVSVGAASNTWANAIGAAANATSNTNDAAGNAWTNTQFTNAQNWANGVGVNANTYATSVGTAANAYSAGVGTNANLYATAVGTAGNAYTVSVGTAANSYAQGWANGVGVNANTYASSVGTAANAYSTGVGTNANLYATAVGTAGNNYAQAVGTAANSYASATYATQTTVATNAVAANNWSNTQYTNAQNWANGVGVNANTYATAVGTAANAYATGVGTNANLYAAGVGTNANLYSAAVGTAANSYASGVGTNANTYATAVGAAANATANGQHTAINAYTVSVGTSANAYAGAMANAANAYAAATYYAKTGGTVSGDLVVTGNLTVSGLTSYVNTTTLLIGDSIFTLNADLPSTSAPTENAGLTINRGNKNSNAAILWIEAANAWAFTANDIGTINNYIASNTDVANVAVSANAYSGTMANSANAYAGAMANAANIFAGAVANVKLANVVASGPLSATFATSVGNTTATLTMSSSAGSGTYSSGISAITVDTYGRVTSVTGSAGYVTSSGVTSVTGTAGQIYSSGGATPTLNLITTAVTAATYGAASGQIVPTVNVDSYGRLISASNVNIDYTPANNYSGTMANSANAYAGAMANAANAGTGTAANTFAGAMANAANAYAGSMANSANIYGMTFANNKLANTSGVSFNGNLNFPVGNVSIGTTSYSAKLDVIGTTTFSSNNYGKTIITAYQDGLTRITSANASGGGVGVLAGTVAIGREPYAVHSQPVGNYNVEIWSGANGATQTLTATGGNVGIGNTAPSSKLVVNATSTTAASLTWDAAAGQIFRNEASELAIGLHNAAPYPLYMQGRTNASGARNLSLQPLGGSVGIGNTAPLSKLHVTGGTAGALADDGIAAFEDSSRNGLSFGYNTSLGHAWIYGRSPGTDARQLQINNLLYVGKGSTSNVGIGTSSDNGSKLTTQRASGVTSYADVHITDGAQFIKLNSNTAGGSYNSLVQARDIQLIFSQGSAGTGGLVIAPWSGASDAGLRMDASGNVAIGQASTTYKLQVNGSFAANTKSFVIDHPSKPGMKLRYGSLEGPENGVYIRGRLTNEHHIQFPDYWKDLVDIDSVTVQLTPIGKSKQPSVGDITDFGVNVIGKNIDCFYFILAERKDVEKLVVEFDA